MNRSTTLLLFLVLLGLETLAHTASAAVLMVDFTDPGLPGPVQPGFTGQSILDATYNLPGGVSILVDLPALADGNDFAEIATRPGNTVLSSGSSFIPDGTNIDALARDFYIHGNNEGTFLTITLSGVAAGMYDFELWFSDVLLVGAPIVQQRVDLSTNGGANFSIIGNPPAHGLQPSPSPTRPTARTT